MTRLIFATSRLLELNIWNRLPFMGGCNLEMVSYAMQHIAKGFAEAPHLKIV
jgi:hypothetical protein